MSDFARKEKIPFIVTDAKSDKITGEKGHRYVFNTNENTMMIGKATALALAKKPYVKYWIMGEDYEFGHACADAIWTNLKAIRPDVQLLGQSWRKVGETDLAPYITPASERPARLHHQRGGRRRNRQLPEGGQSAGPREEGPHLSALRDGHDCPSPPRPGRA